MHVQNLVEQVQGNLSSQTPTQASTSTPANTPIQANVTSRTQTQVSTPTEANQISFYNNACLEMFI